MFSNITLYNNFSASNTEGNFLMQNFVPKFTFPILVTFFEQR
jgi:hypothetical protein